MTTDVKDSSMSNRQAGLIVGAVLIFIFLAVGVWWLLRTDYEPLLSESNSESRAETLAMLMQWQIPYKVEDATGEISIPSDQIAQTRARLSGVGLPAAQVAGLELFGQTDYGMSEFAQRINYQRGLEGELARTIRTFEEVKAARVHLTLAKNSLFENRKESSKASVAVQLKPNKTLTQQQIQGIQQLISSAVIGLNPEQVVVLDEFGQPLLSNDDSGVDRWSTVRRVENEYEERGRHLIAGIIPGAEINISVKLQLNFDRVKTVKETIITAPNNNGYLLRQRDQVINGKSPSGENSVVTQQNKTTETEYVYGKEHAEIEYASGDITRINVGVVIVDHSLSQDMNDAIHKVLRSGLGLLDERGDSIAVVGSAQNRMVSEATDVSLVLEENNKLEHKYEITDEKVEAPEFPLIQWLLIIGIIIASTMIVYLLSTRKSGETKTPSLTDREREQLLMELRSWLAQERKEAK